MKEPFSLFHLILVRLQFGTFPESGNLYIKLNFDVSEHFNCPLLNGGFWRYVKILNVTPPLPHTVECTFVLNNCVLFVVTFV